MSRLSEMVEEAADAIGVKRVFGEPYVKNGVTVIPAARFTGGAGGGESTLEPPPGEEGAGETRSIDSGGGGFGVGGRPAGAFVIRGNDVQWMPAIDVNRLVFGFQVVMVVFLLVVRTIIKSRAETARAVARETARAKA
ncbi:hypothetical protein BH23CHL7_BH23CHL7_07870 [soil metagenome]